MITTKATSRRMKELETKATALAQELGLTLTALLAQIEEQARDKRCLQIIQDANPQNLTEQYLQRSRRLANEAKIKNARILANINQHRR